MPHWLLIGFLVLNLAIVVGCLVVSRPTIFKKSPTEPSLSPLSPGAPLGTSSQIQGPGATTNSEIPNFPRKGVS